jgi:hydrogenase nickel incorporation protein HypA/HybF
MHEMSIVTSILEIAQDHADRADAKIIREIEVEVGALAGIETAALDFCFQAARGQSVGEQAELVIRNVPGVGHCPACGQDSPMDFYAAVCPACNDAVLEVRQGREMRVLSIRVD